MLFSHLFSELKLRHKSLLNGLVFGARTANMTEQGAGVAPRLAGHAIYDGCALGLRI